MTAPAAGQGRKIKSEEVVFHKADGTPTKNSDEAATAEVTTTYEDGSVGHTLLRARGDHGPAAV